MSPINYKRVAEADGKEVPWDEIVKGYEYEKGQFVVLKEEDFRRADIEATQSVDIMEFVPLEEIDPIFFDRPACLSGASVFDLRRWIHFSKQPSKKRKKAEPAAEFPSVRCWSAMGK